MSQKKSSAKKLDELTVKFVLTLGAAVSLIFWLPLQDPINIPKFFLLVTGAILLLPQAIAAVNRYTWKLTIPILLFSGILLFEASIDDNLYRAFFGTYGRNTGAITYISLTVILLAVIKLSQDNSFHGIENLFVSTSTILITYGFIQYSGNDFANWINPFSPIVLSFGNPNFASAFMGISSVILTGISLQPKIRSTIRVISLTLTLLLITLIYLSQSQQGFLVISAGISILLIPFIQKMGSKILILYTTLIAAIGFLGLFGLLKSGPLANYLYQPSISFRGDYWRAAIDMFKKNPISGIGLDNYGNNFTIYRDSVQVLRDGPDVIADSAHNTYLQLAATGGIALIILYFSIQGIILYCGIRNLNTHNKNQEMYFAHIIFSAWMGFQMQSLVSIDNIGIAFWGWIFGGIVIGEYLKYQTINDENKERKLVEKKVLSSIVVGSRVTSVSIAVVFVVFMTNLFSADAQIRQARFINIDLKSDDQALYKASEIIKVVQKNKYEKQYKIQVAQELTDLGYLEEATKQINKLGPELFRDRKALYTLGAIQVKNKNTTAIIEIRKKIYEIDPLNYQNLAALVVNLVEMNSFVEASQYLEKINQFAASTKEYAEAAAILIRNSEIVE